MDSITLKAPAKINLSLDVTGKKENGYHTIESIFQTVSIFDIVSVSKRSSGINIICSKEGVPCDKSNIAYKAAELFFSYTGINSGAEIKLEKHIPSQAGLGGGSSDGASVLIGLDKIFETSLKQETLCMLGGKISADTAFFTLGGTAYVTGIGEILEVLPQIPETHFVIAKGDSGVSTPEAYGKIDQLENPVHPEVQKLKQAILNGRFTESCELCGNLFEQVTDLSDVCHIKNEMKEMGALSAVMSGSGSSVFGIFETENQALVCTDKLGEKYEFSQYCKSI